MAEIFIRDYMRPNTSPITPKEIERAYEVWLKTYEFAELDRAIEKFLTVESLIEGSSQLQNARKALLITTRSAAQRLGKSKVSFSQFEKSERAGTISLNSLKEAASAIDCEVVYSIRPKRRVLYSRIVFEEMLGPNLNKGFLFKCAPTRRGEALAWFISRQIEDVSFRAEKGWTRRLAEPSEPLLWRSAQEHKQAK